MRQPPLILRLQRWFEANPEESLYVADVMTKFEVGMNAARSSLYGLEASGFLRRSSEQRPGMPGRALFVYELAQKEPA